MDSKIYFHQSRRPRYNNPTFISNNVNNSLTFFNSKNTSAHQYDQYLNQSVNINNGDNARNSYRSVDKYNKVDNLSTINHPVTNQQQTRGQSVNRRQYNNSNLSSYGSNSLNLNQKDIFNKQNQRYDIISMRPKGYDTSIRQYPAFTIQNKDQLYYKRMAEQMDKKNHYQNQKYHQLKNNRINSHNHNQDNFIAGKHTYDAHNQRNFSNNNTTNVLTNSYSNPEHVERYNTNDKVKYFDPKMLNHMDELNNLS